MRSWLRPRWKLLIAIASTIVVLDQWTKFLAVKHLTPGIEMAHAKATGEANPDLGEVGWLTQLRYFYGSVEQPCKNVGTRCPEIRLFDKLWHWNYAENPGSAWSFLAKASPSIRVPFFITVSALAIALILWFYNRLQGDQRLLMLALATVLGGAIGNFIDRVRLTYVIDFIVWYIGSYRWPTFNIADSAISTGVGLLVLDSILDAFRKKKKAEEEQAEGARA